MLKEVSSEIVNVGGTDVKVTTSVTADNAAVNVLWFSRHDMSEEQLTALTNKVGDVKIVKVDGTVPNAFVLKDFIAAADVIAIVAPINMQQQFLKLSDGKPVITAVSDRILVSDENGGESKVQFQFNHWDLIKKIVVETEEFCR